MATLPSPLPRRLRLDPRIVLGLVLVAVSTLGVTGVVQGLNRTEPVYRAAGPLVAGAHISAADLVATPVRLGPADPLYLTGPVPADGYVVTRTIAAGEMVPLSALGSASAVDVASVVVDLSTRLSGSIVAGAVVDVWSAPRKAGFDHRVRRSGRARQRRHGGAHDRAAGASCRPPSRTRWSCRCRGTTSPPCCRPWPTSARISAVAVSQPVHR